MLHVETKLDVLKTGRCRAELVDLACCDESQQMKVHISLVVKQFHMDYWLLAHHQKKCHGDIRGLWLPFSPW